MLCVCKVIPGEADYVDSSDERGKPLTGFSQEHVQAGLADSKAESTTDILNSVIYVTFQVNYIQVGVARLSIPDHS